MSNKRHQDIETASIAAREYTLDETTGVWTRPGAVHQPDELSQELQSALSGVADISADSDELRFHVTPGLAAYIGSEPLNALRPVRHLLSGRVLVVANDYGNATRFIAEHATDVTSLAATYGLATAVAARCRDLSNVAVICDNTPLTADLGTFDTVVLYEPAATDNAPTHVPSILRWIRGTMAVHATLILVIENRFGLTRFAGNRDATVDASENPAAIGRSELDRYLQDAGFTHREFLLLFPDSHVPKAVLSPAMLNEDRPETAALLQSFGATYTSTSGYSRHFPEALLWRGLLSNGIVQDLANGFLVVASTAPKLPAHIAAYAYTTNRRRCFQKETLITTTGDPWRVIRSRLHEDAGIPAGPVVHHLHDEPFLAGRIYGHVLADIVNRPGWTLNDVLGWADPYIRFLEANVRSNVNGEEVLPENFVDCTPLNVMVQEGGLVPFDLEWHAVDPPTLAFVCFRGLLYTFGSLVEVAPPDDETDLRILPLVLTVMEKHGRGIGGEDLDRLWQVETALQVYVGGEHVTVDEDYWKTTMLQVRAHHTQAERPPEAGTGNISSGGDSYLFREVISAKDSLIRHLSAERIRLATAVNANAVETAAMRLDFARAIDALRTELSAARQEREERLQRLSEGAQVIQGLKSTAAGLEKSLADSKRESEELKRQLLQTSVALEHARGDYEALSAKAAAHGAETVALRQQLTDLELTAAAAQQESDQLRQRLLHAAANAEQLRIANESLAATLQSEKATLSHLKDGQTQNIGQLRTETETRATLLLNQISNREGEIASVRDDLARERVRIQELERSLGSEQLQALRLSHDLRQLRSSLSWRITAPMRSGFDIVMNAAVRVLSLARRSVLLFAPGHRAIFRKIRDSGLFDAEYYLATYPDVRFRPVDPLIHYMYAGMGEHRWPNPLFDPAYYVARQPDAHENPLLHYIETGEARHVRCHPLFNAEYYKAQCGDAIARSGLTALGHYLRHGASQDYDPHPLFSTAFYMRQAPPGKGPGLLRYLAEPAGQPGNNPHPLFETAHYLRRYPDVAAAGINPLMHYVLHGAVHIYDPHWLFDAGYYVRTAKLPPGELPLEHYVLHGSKEGRMPHPLFDPALYLESNPEVRRTGTDPLEHFLTAGWRAGKQPHPLFDSGYYFETHPDAAASGINAVQYFLETGAALGHSPHPLFATDHYLQQVSGPTTPPALLHFIEHGRELRASPHPLFDSAYYLDRYPDVAETGMNPLAHYLKVGVAEGRNPHPLFHTRFYSHRYKGELYGMNPLVHYARFGGTLQWSPHPLFDAAFYLRARPDVRRCGVPALIHYASCSGTETTDPHPLFDTRYYREQLPTLGFASPLIHYVRQGWRTYNPNLLFDAAFYRAAHPEGANAGTTPLEHYLSNWSNEGVNPHPLFDSRFYLDQNPALQEWQSPLEHYRAAKPSLALDPHPEFATRHYVQQVPGLDDTGLTALEHYLTTGATNGLDPSPHFKTREYMRLHPEVLETGMNPLVHLVLSRSAPTVAEAHTAPVPDDSDAHGTLRLFKLRHHQDVPPREDGHTRSGKVVLCATHVVFHPPRAGNEYRFNRLLRHLEQQGYRTIVLFVPLEPVPDSVLQGLATAAPDLIVCKHDGSVLYQLQNDESVLTVLEGARIPSLPSLFLEENAPADQRSAELIQVDRTFSHDALCKVALHLHRHFQPCAILANYIFMTRFLPFVPADSLKLIDTIDVFSTKASKVMSFGVDDGLSMSAQEERKRLLRAHVILAIQDGERKEFEAIVPERRVLTVGVDFDVEQENAPAAAGKDIVLVASDNPMNVKGLRDFLRFAWPIIAREEPDARFLVAGRASQTTMAPDERVSLLGPVDDVQSLYRRARVVINPAVAGTGLKIKTVEALCHFRPVICRPNGFDGLEERVAKLCPVATDWFEFAAHVVRVLRDSRQHWFSDADAELIRNSLSAATVYRDLDATLQAYFETYDVEAATVRRS